MKTEIEAMCGICGKLTYHSTPMNPDLIRRMCDQLGHRGPDQDGIYIRNMETGDSMPVALGLGHRRLSVIDLSDAAAQPMTNESKTLWITYNGEIYNYKELRNQLIQKGHKFTSDSDTEVILHLYEEEGLDAVHQLNGMFAFGLWDEHRKRLWLCRDRAGIKPLIYYYDGNTLVFASEIKALVCDKDIARQLDLEALQLYLAFNYVPAPYTMFQGIRKLAPGHSLVLENNTLKIDAYWQLPDSTASHRCDESRGNLETVLSTRLYKCLQQAVTDRMIADVPLGAFLSGGIDSSIVVALMARNSSRPIQTFSIGFSDEPMYDETRYARSVARLYGTDHHEFHITQKDMIESLPAVLEMFDEPFADSSAIPTYLVSKETRKHVTVALSGDGGDELFGGYRSYLAEVLGRWYRMIPSLLRSSVIEPVVAGLPDSREVKLLEYVRRGKKFIKAARFPFFERCFALKEVIPWHIRKSLVSTDPQKNDLALKWLKGRIYGYPDDSLNRILHQDVRDSLPGDMLTKVDWMSMANSLEVRVPFLDYRVMQLAFQIPGSLKIRHLQTKYILKKTFRHLLPSELYRRPKAGFEIPLSRWLKQDLKYLLETYLSRQRIGKQGIFNTDSIEHLVVEHLEGKTDTAWMLWNMIVFQYWYDRYF